MVKIGDLVDLAADRHHRLFSEPYLAWFNHTTAYMHGVGYERANVAPFLVMERKMWKGSWDKKEKSLRVVRLHSVPTHREFWTCDENLVILSRGR